VGGTPGVAAGAGFAGIGGTAAGAPAAGALGFGAAVAGDATAGAFAPGVAGAAAGFAAAAVATGFGAERKNPGVGIIPDLFSSISMIRKKIPAIIAHTKSSMIPSMPLVSSPLVMSQTIPQRANNIKRPQIALISIAVLLGAIPSSLPVTAAVID
jgi:hypothetical protein